MRMKLLFTGFLLAVIPIFFVSCLDSDMTDKVSIVNVSIASETEEVVRPSGLGGQLTLQEFLKVKFEGDAVWSRLHLGEIAGFRFEDGNEYMLEIKRTELAVPPADGSSVVYELSKILSKTKKNPDIYKVERFYISKISVVIKGDGLTEEEKTAIESKALADFPVPCIRSYKFIHTDENLPMGNVIIYTNEKKETGSFKRTTREEEGTKYTVSINGEQHDYWFVRHTEPTYEYFVFAEDITQKYKDEYPNLEQLLVQQHIDYASN